MNRCGAVVLMVLAAALVGCRSAGSSDAVPSGSEIVQLNIITAPVGLNLDDKPGADGFSVKVYANEAKRPKAVPIPNGQLEILIFDGSFFGRTNVPPALRTWTFQTADLKPHAFKAEIGHGYGFLLPWGTNRPTERLITVAARYTTSGGRVIGSRPSSVAVVNK